MSDGMRDSANGVGRYLFGTHGKYEDETPDECRKCGAATCRGVSIGEDGFCDHCRSQREQGGE